MRRGQMYEHGRQGVRVMREDNPATEVANAMSKCLSACAVLASPHLWAWLRAKPPDVQRDIIVDGVAWFVETASLDSLPEVRAFGISKDAIRQAAASATALLPLVTAWDTSTDPTPPMMALAHEVLTAMGIPEGHEFPLPGD